MTRSSGLGGHTSLIRSALVSALGLIIGFALGGLLLAPNPTQAAGRNQYKVERLGMQARDPAGLQELLEQRAEQGWLLQALDHDTMIFRRAPVPRPTPAPTPEP